jgi:hypothetical protein
MGHIRLGDLPRTRRWIQVLDLVGGGAGAPRVAAATLEAAQMGLANASKDPGLIQTVWLLTQVPLAARAENFVGHLRHLGLEVSNSPSLLDVAGAFTGAVDHHLRERGGRTDLGEMAEMAAAESLIALGTPPTPSPFRAVSTDTQRVLKAFTTNKQFSSLAREFFARLTRKYLTYSLSRELSNYVSGDGRFANIVQHAEFNAALDLHCRQASRIVEEFSGGWFSKANFQEGITPRKAARFVHVAMKKITAELKRAGTA